MATNAASALEWFNTTKPNRQQLSTMLEKLEERISNDSNIESDLTGTIEALDLLQQLFIENFEEATPESADINLNENPNVYLDATPLGDSANMESEQLSEEERKKRFNKLKNQLNIL